MSWAQRALLPEGGEPELKSVKSEERNDSGGMEVVENNSEQEKV